MAQITTVLLPPYTIPKAITSEQHRSITSRFSPTEFAANITTGDRLAIATLPKDAEIIAAGVRFLGVSGNSLAFVTLQSNENSTMSLLTNPLSATMAGSIGMISAPPSVDTSYVKTLELLVGGADLDSTATGIIVVTCQYRFYQEAG